MVEIEYSEKEINKGLGLIENAKDDRNRSICSLNQIYIYIYIYMLREISKCHYVV